mmetsp:Transcript_15338/g.25319  ORF Transcript_15338/g.25319 Transcript_15338/m.25319 type:complete len:226 (-) Transcript_15338:1799-2476(-)
MRATSSLVGGALMPLCNFTGIFGGGNGSNVRVSEPEGLRNGDCDEELSLPLFLLAARDSCKKSSAGTRHLCCCKLAATCAALLGCEEEDAEGRRCSRELLVLYVASAVGREVRSEEGWRSGELFLYVGSVAWKELWSEEGRRSWGLVLCVGSAVGRELRSEEGRRSGEARRWRAGDAGALLERSAGRDSGRLVSSAKSSSSFEDAAYPFPSHPYGSAEWESCWDA